MDKFKKMMPYLLIILFDFYLLPSLIKDKGAVIIMLLVVVPLICLGCATVYGVKNGFSFLFCVIVTIFYVPTIFIFYNSSAWIYIIGCGVTAIVGNALGMLFKSLLPCILLTNPHKIG